MLTHSIIEHRRDLARAHHALSSRGTRITLNQLQKFYYAQFRTSHECASLLQSMEAELNTDDGLDDYCAICSQRAFPVAAAVACVPRCRRRGVRAPLHPRNGRVPCSARSMCLRLPLPRSPSLPPVAPA